MLKEVQSTKVNAETTYRDTNMQVRMGVIPFNVLITEHLECTISIEPQHAITKL